jgi:hypothetical protein
MIKNVAKSNDSVAAYYPQVFEKIKHEGIPGDWYEPTG